MSRKVGWHRDKDRPCKCIIINTFGEAIFVFSELIFMKNRIYVKDLASHVGKEVLIKGFAHTIRVQSKIIFLLVRDISGIIQTVIEISSDAFEVGKNLSSESVISVVGIVKSAPQAPGGIEIGVSSIDVLSMADPELPIPVVGQKGGEETEEIGRAHV